MAVPARLETSLVASFFDENSPHRLGRSREEMAPAVPLLNLVGIDQAEIGFMHQGGGLEGLPGFFPRDLFRGQFTQLIVDQRQQPLGGLRIALVDGGQESSHVAHEADSPSVGEYNWQSGRMPVGREAPGPAASP